ncbi:hypothetical protein MPSEU_000857500 [Mayamaea pseudoterrestris]|nr:hypothetical protein MPSEU_000857500 [Mayamaea pseudoterrestris]
MSSSPPPSPFADLSGNTSIIEQAFGKSCNLYSDVLDCSKDASKAILRKAYYRAALAHHPDRHQSESDAESLESHKQKFQAISLTYQILGNDELRAEYDKTGVIPGRDHDEDIDSKDYSAWKDYFSSIFGSVTTSKIDAFASKYKCSEEERRDVLKFFVSRKGNLVKVLECVMLSEPRDVKRWVEDFLEPAFLSGELDASKLRTPMEKSLKQCLKLAEKENQEEDELKESDDDESDDDDSDDETETDEEEVKRPTPIKKAKASPKKGHKTQAKAKSSSHKKNSVGDMDSLVAAIRNKKQQTGGDVFADLAMRYGGKLDEDPLSDEAFAKAQSKVNKKARRK